MANGKRPPETGRGAAYFLTRAEQCFRLAEGVYDRETERRLRELGFEFAAEAALLGALPADIPPHWRRRPAH